jgi:hypothetical protein
MSQFVAATPCHLFEIGSTPTVNRAGWHVAHLLNVKDGDTDWTRWPRSRAVRRFVRNLHPCNVFYVPLTDWERHGADPALIASVAAYYRARYAAVWPAFAELAGAPSGLGLAAPDGPLVIDPPDAATSAVTDAKARQAATRRALADEWAAILAVDHAPPIGALLARHPDAETLTLRLLTGLTVERLVAIADALHNQARLSRLREAAPGDTTRQAELAWGALVRGVGKTHRPSGWTGAAKLLVPGQDAGLTAVASLDIGRVAGVGARIVAGPYRRACQLGLR